MKNTFARAQAVVDHLVANIRMLVMLLRHQADAAIPRNEEMFKEPENAMEKAARRVC